MIPPHSGRPRVGTAGWSLPAPTRDAFSDAASGLARYATRLDAVEINSSFYRPHRPATYGRWAASVPDGFRFAVKLSKAVTHERRLADAEALIDRFLAETAALGAKLGPVLIQLPPSLAFDPAVAGAFFALLRRRTAGYLACEPRHPSWFTPVAERMLVEHRVARVAADPPSAPGADRPGGWTGLVYRRLHGSPKVYVSDYPPDRLDTLAAELLADSEVEAWCVFDNTALGHATRNALDLVGRLDPGGRPRVQPAPSTSAPASPPFPDAVDPGGADNSGVPEPR